MVTSTPSLAVPKRLNTVDEYKVLLDKFDTFLLDCDGKRLVFVTNNSTMSRANYVKKFEKLGIEAKEDDIFSSAFATAAYLKNVQKFPEDKRVFVIGESGIVDELKLVGIESTGASDDNGATMTHGDFGTIEDDPTIGAVVCGFDINLNYRKLARAYKYLSKKDQKVEFILTNDDSTFPAFNGHYPGTGSLAQPLIHALKRQPLVMGKPNKPMLDSFFNSYHSDPARTCMVGDRLDTDIAFGINGNIETLLVLTGVSTEEEAMDPEQPIKPTYIIQGFGEFAKVKNA
ncbi:hypothetical protein BGZ98_007818 [Dissophora globulifera]|uniref:4-nitrophenylphosphatase n=1 Tax=Dissophora globulifera TaxID=979702 RepID=A0A9P6UU72_9FUNG|nr:hypothetical protein BGZ98_007818 [Dissophora globulifera]KAG0319491.1 hypothetical protein BGZ99_005080 [Dissophora globulifera]